MIRSCLIINVMFIQNDTLWVYQEHTGLLTEQSNNLQRKIVEFKRSKNRVKKSRDKFKKKYNTTNEKLTLLLCGNERIKYNNFSVKELRKENVISDSTLNKIRYKRNKAYKLRRSRQLQTT